MTAPRANATSTLTGRLPADLANAISDVLRAYVDRGMADDEAVCVAVAVIADYARREYGPVYLGALANVVITRAHQPLPDNLGAKA